MAQLEHIEAIEKRLWSAADTLRANSNFAANEFFMPVMGLIFLRHAYSRYLAVKEEVVKSLPSRGGKTREPTKEDFSAKGAVFLRPEAQFDYLVSLPDSVNRAEAIIKAMESILTVFNRILMSILEQLKVLCFSIRNLASTRDMLLPKLMKDGI
ncbi:MAG: type I restriction-modification system subunit M N-terminal domain-containing protein [Lentisphaeria bacterium]|nr:type I restriction-modification system subunit M N-terminal domain-containing protein [Victivallales bacterium]MCR4573892.1 type I restriction-modification system subunit M N-terminal domain-containing protein [Lentisphaeria bacterium]